MHKRNIFRVWLAVAIAAVVLAAAPPVAAQVSDTDVLQQLRTEIGADRQALVVTNLGLTDEQGEAFWPVYRAYRADMEAIGDRMQMLIQDFAEIWDMATEEQAKAMVDEMLDIQRDEVKVRKSYLSKFRKVLPEVKVARLYQIENKIDIIIKTGIAEAIPLMESGK